MVCNLHAGEVVGALSAVGVVNVVENCCCVQHGHVIQSCN